VLDPEAIDRYAARITALFTDFLTFDIENREWTRLQNGLEAILWQIQAEPADYESVGQMRKSYEKKPDCIDTKRQKKT